MPTLAAGFVTRLDAVWDTGSSTVAADTVTLTEWSTGSARYWTGSAWTTTPTALTVPVSLTVPASWEGLEVGVLYTWAAYPELSDDPIVVPSPNESTTFHADIS